MEDVKGVGGKEKERFHFLLFPDNEDSSPKVLSSNDLDQLRKAAFEEMSQAKCGWAYFIIDGERCLVSKPLQIIKVRKPDGSFIELPCDVQPVFPNDGRFDMLLDRSAGLPH